MIARSENQSIKASRAGQDGASLIEILVALVISSLLGIGLLEIFMNSSRTYHVSDQFARMQENARYAGETLARSLRFVGHLGCRSRNAQTNPRLTVLANPPMVVPGNGFTSYSAGGGTVYVAPDISGQDNLTSPTFGAVPGVNIGSAVRGTDTLTVLYAESCGGGLARGVAFAGVDPRTLLQPTEQCNADVNSPSGAGDPLVISDCETQHIFRAAKDNTQNTRKDGVATTLLGKAYTDQKNGQVFNYRAYTYYIRYTGGSDMPGLYRRTLTGDARGGTQEIIEGVENMQLDYGVDVDGDGSANQFVSAATLNAGAGGLNWNQVISVRVALTFRSLDDNLASSPSRVSFNGGNITDRRLRRTITSTYSLRNRIG